MFWLLNMLVGAGNIAYIVSKGKEVYEKLEEEGYEIKQKKYSTFESIINALPVVALSLIPIFNVAFLLFLMYYCSQDETYEGIKQKLIREGKIYKRDVVEATPKKAYDFTFEKENDEINTMEDAFNVMFGQRKDIPTMDFDYEADKDNDDEIHYQKTIGKK